MYGSRNISCKDKRSRSRNNSRSKNCGSNYSWSGKNSKRSTNSVVVVREAAI